MKKRENQKNQQSNQHGISTAGMFADYLVEQMFLDGSITVEQHDKMLEINKKMKNGLLEND